jgi:hypothetical protein
LDTPRAQPVTATGQVVTADSDTNPTVSQAALMTADPPVSTSRMHEPREPQPATVHEEAPASGAEDADAYESTPHVAEPVVEPSAQSIRSEPPVREPVPQMMATPRAPEPAYEPPAREPEPPVMETRRPAEPTYEPPAASTSTRPQTFALPSDLVQVETSHAQSPGLVEQPRPEELPRRPRRPQGQAEEPVAQAEPLVQIETRRDGTLDGSQSGS